MDNKIVGDKLQFQDSLRDVLKEALHKKDFDTEDNVKSLD